VIERPARTSTGAGRKATAPRVECRIFPTDDGEFFIALDRTDGDRLVECGWTELRTTAIHASTDWIAHRQLAPALVERIRAAIVGEAIDFTDLLLPPASPFFDACRRAAQAIPAGTTLTYGALADRAGSPAASRAAGQAMRRNPVPIVVPCHRVVAASGAIGGFAGSWSAGWGEEGGFTGLKARLLAREAARAATGNRRLIRGDAAHPALF
jgi:O-6-methylguanine DNA methyltransferase